MLKTFDYLKAILRGDPQFARQQSKLIGFATKKFELL